MKTYGVVLIGCGAMGAAHMENLHRHGQVNLIGVADLIEEKAKRFAQNYKAASWNADYREYLSREDVDIVIISTYPSSHLAITKECLEAGKHVLCEKPMTSNLQDAEEFMRVAASAKGKVMVGHILRHNETFQRVIRMIRQGAIGSPIVMRMSQIKKTKENWSSHLSLLGEVSPIVDCGVHYVDVMRWATGADVSSVSGIGMRLEPDVPSGTYNYGMITLKLSDGSVGYYEAGWGHAVPNENLKEFIGPKGRIRIIYKSQRDKDSQLGNLVEFEHYPSGIREEINIGFDSKPTGAQFDYFLNMIAENIDPLPFLEEVFLSMQAVTFGDIAIREGRTMTCPPARLPVASNL